METYLHECIPQVENCSRDQGEWIFKDLGKGHLAEKKFLKHSFQNFFNLREKREVRKGGPDFWF